MPARRAAIGVVNQEITMDPFFTPIQALELQAGYYGVPKSERRSMEILTAVGLDDKKDAYVRQLSGGMKRRLMVAKALVHNPPVLILDEPTAGVSPIVMDELFDRIIEIAKTGIAILMVEQNAKQALNIADKGYVLVQGRNRYTDTGAALMADPEVRKAFLGG